MIAHHLRSGISSPEQLFSGYVIKPFGNLFDNPLLYGQDDEKQYVVVKAIFSDFEPGWDDDKVLARALIPATKETEASPKAAAAM